jgi:hypothetical protein
MDIPWSEWQIPWAALGGFLLGLGSALSGLAAIMTARRAAKEVRDEDHPKSDNSSSVRVNDGGGERVSDGDSPE